ncbi:MAG: benzoyl-CoA reductase, bzd-type, subunit N [Candidatus Fischerbacteria bacterium RBG_13_37_8]|uniref:Benzoyl-CoA reductase, bzd-type, subunit N n=1 Tax=Candidatus Fischerbacteria bacterium RBG_13_37_8 TaxID=1817863 RepID=A0A1F5V5U3_9BACT|nr:MAG: benzoyl-CoA reductase, bzd-type, subunit N [Candidatus Fischerbacteria bacterium RBG_13_37_8]
MIDIFKDWYEHRHDYAKEWKKRTKGEVVGYFCTYAPEEIMYAAGILPVRILGSHEPQDVTEPHIFGMFCPFCRDCLAQGLKGRFDYLGGIMLSQSCLHLRQSYTSWQINIPVPFSYYLPMPHGVQSKRAYKYLRNELETFKKAVEKWLGKEIKDEDIDRAIEIYNKNRQLLHKLYALRKSSKVPLSGMEAMYVTITSQMVDKAEHNEMLEKYINTLTDRDVTNDRVRLIFVGSEDDDIEFIKMVESLPAIVVVDEHCTGSRYFWNEVKQDDDRLMAIAARYIDRPACPAKDWPELTRLDHIVNLVKDYNVQGAVLIQQKFCDPHEFDMPVIEKKLKEMGIPSYNIEFDVTVPIGQFKIRIEAFLEMLRADELF